MIPKLTLFLLLLSLLMTAQAGSMKALQKNKIALYIPHIIDHKYVGFEFGYVLKKKWKKLGYPCNAFVKAILIEESPSKDDLRAAGLGAKAGLILPTQPWVPLYLEASFGYAKTILHKSPWVGERDDTVERKSMYLVEFGAMLVIKRKFILRVNYQLNNVDYFYQKSYFSVGVNF